MTGSGDSRWAVNRLAMSCFRHHIGLFRFAGQGRVRTRSWTIALKCIGNPNYPANTREYSYGGYRGNRHVGTAAAGVRARAVMG
jgi:hypothetical protein